MGATLNRRASQENVFFFMSFFIPRWSRNTKKEGSRKYKDYDEDTLKTAMQKVKDQEMSMRKASAIYKNPIGNLSNKLQGLHEL